MIWDKQLCLIWIFLLGPISALVLFFSFSGKNGSSFFKYSISHLKSNLLPLLTICSLIINKMPIWHIYPLLPWQRGNKKQQMNFVRLFLFKTYLTVKYEENPWLCVANEFDTCIHVEFISSYKYSQWVYLLTTLRRNGTNI